MKDACVVRVGFIKEQAVCGLISHLPLRFQLAKSCGPDPTLMCTY